MVFIFNPWGSVLGRSRGIKKIEDDERDERIGMKEGESLGGGEESILGFPTRT